MYDLDAQGKHDGRAVTGAVKRRITLTASPQLSFLFIDLYFQFHLDSFIALIVTVATFSIVSSDGAVTQIPSVTFVCGAAASKLTCQHEKVSIT